MHRRVTDPNDDAPDGAVIGAYERHGSSWEPLPKGTKVSIDVVWPNGKTSRMRGTLISVKEDEAYVETALGAVVGPEESVEVEE
jgi:hypothetical protein